MNYSGITKTQAVAAPICSDFRPRFAVQEELKADVDLRMRCIESALKLTPLIMF